MELLYVDQFEALPVGTVFSSNANASAREFVKMAQPTSSLQVLTLVAGTLSGREIEYADSTVGTNAYLIGSVEVSLTSGKFIAAAAVRITFRTGGTHELFGVRKTGGGDEYLSIGADKKVKFLGQSSEVTVDVAAYNFFELEIDFSGGFNVYVNNAIIMTGVHTLSALDAVFVIGRTSAKHTFVIDNIYMLGGTTGPFTDRLGPVRATRAPLLSATETNFTPVGAATNINAVNKTTLSEDAFNRSPASNNKADLFKLDMSAIPNDKDIIAISNQLLYRKTDIGSRNLGIVSKYGANIEREELPINLGVFAGHAPQIITELPGGGSLDYEEVEDMEFGYEVKA